MERGLITGRWIIPIEEIRENTGKVCGGKASVLGTLSREGLTVPAGVCICTAAYETYVDRTGLRGRILLELSRKPFEEMRWEELWDISEKIKHMFTLTPFPGEMEKELEEGLASHFGDKAVAVRSSAPGEDSANTSFAGVHASYVNIRGARAILRHLRLVWASLWSDTALLYRKEMGLDILSSAMAVLVQEMIEGRVSGVAFGENPDNESEAVIEAVYGLNRGLVDGTVEPDRWNLARQTGSIKTHMPAEREKAVFAGGEGSELKALPEAFQKTPPLTPAEVLEVFELARKAENLFGVPQDIEWTFRDSTLYILQARPITTILREDRDEKRRWYLSLRRSFENLKELRKAIEEKYIPAMQAEARDLERENIERLSDSALAGEIERRAEIYRKWYDIYWEEFIPFAHGARLFGKVYNETINPEDPYEFADLLSGTEMLSLERNRKLEEISGKIRKSPELIQSIKEQIEAEETAPEKESRPEPEIVPAGETRPSDTDTRHSDTNRTELEGRPEIEAEGKALTEFKEELDSFISRYGGSYSESPGAKKGLYRLLLEMALHPPAPMPAEKISSNRMQYLKEKFISGFEDKNKQCASELLDLGRASYRLRDDDNIYLGKIEAELKRAFFEGRKRLIERVSREARLPEEAQAFYAPELTAELTKTLRDPSYSPKWKKPPLKSKILREKVKPRQLLGNPSGRGVAEGFAKVILKETDLFNLKAGEVLVCDAVDPNMTFIVPLCSAIVERRGGMLIHGAIIAREYGIPCVTGVPDATELIKNGDYLAVDGYLGIVTVLKRRE
ncbi:PEP/pyruvate-binding domain-containing protein [Methanosarcina sp. 1.H.T.1A.1]|uniref:PEP/pyruvate-binding domain-containing protein n=1 Tax=Methanosarcina sp. 1.H.T.1A.1 TaxID=1483602 RepID=UPI0009E5D385|nr:PEP/pyruvate-binding domain-containing protein [Methanosarcina sp. 1.H.T.1A.1]